MSAQASATHPVKPAGTMNPGHWVLLVLGVVLAAVGGGLTAGGSVLLGGAAAQHDGGYVLSGTERLRTTGYALTSPSARIDLGGTGAAGAPGMPALGDLAGVEVRAASAVPGQAIFVGIADSSKVSDYLRDVPSASVGNVSWSIDGLRPGNRVPSGSRANAGEIQPSAGNRAPAAPTAQGFWAVSASGTGTQSVAFDLKEGSWSLVVMNADGSRPVWADVQVGVRSSLFGPVGSGLLASGLIGVVVGILLLLFGAAGLGRDIGAPTTAADPAAVYPLRFTGYLDPHLSRGLWIVKWLLAIPHGIVLAILWFALFVSTIAAGFAILFTGRYPRSLFSFSVGVMRWTWRVGFYTYSALGTDRYPPFTLASADYPADLDVPYPERLSRGLVLVKWWLLALPQLLIVAALTGSAGSRGAGVWWDTGAGSVGANGGAPLLGLLVLFAAVVVLFTGRYSQELFAFVVGINRWLFRVWTYVLLLRDEYPPLRLDQGPTDPAPPSGPSSQGPNGAPPL